MRRYGIGRLGIYFLLLLVLGIALSSNPGLSVEASSQLPHLPVPPSTFFGNIQRNGSNLPAGIEVTAWISETRYATALTFIESGVSVYRIDVPGDDPSTAEQDGGREGNKVTFKVGDSVLNQTAIWQLGHLTELNLIVTAPLPPTVTITPTPTPTKVPTSTFTPTSTPTPTLTKVPISTFTPTATTTPTPTPTTVPTATSTGRPTNDPHIYLPVIIRSS